MTGVLSSGETSSPPPPTSPDRHSTCLWRELLSGCLVSSERKPHRARRPLKTPTLAVSINGARTEAGLDARTRRCPQRLGLFPPRERRSRLVGRLQKHKRARCKHIRNLRETLAAPPLRQPPDLRSHLGSLCASALSWPPGWTPSIPQAGVTPGP